MTIQAPSLGTDADARHPLYLQDRGRLLFFPDVCELFGFTDAELRKWRAEGTGPSFFARGKRLAIWEVDARKWHYEQFERPTARASA